MSFLSRRQALVAISSLVAVLLVPAAGLAQQKTVVKFEAGNDNAYFEGRVKGDGYHDYILGAKAGQRMGVSLMGSAYFNILPPGSNDVAIYNSSIDGNDATNVVLPRNGNYKIRVYLMGNASDSGKTVSYQISTSIMN